jgi:uncharacterized protein DUF5107
VVLVRFAVCLAACVLQAAVRAQDADKVSLSESTITWHTVKYETDANGGFIDGSLDEKTIVDRTFRIYVLENRYLKVTLLPEFGGRVLSMIYKPTGHEELYRTQVGVPYGIRAGNFYYDWMMVYGGIFPTFPTAEHGKTWLRPWNFRIVKQSDAEVMVAMSITDDVDYTTAPSRFGKGATGLNATYYVTLKAGRAAIDARLVLENPGHQPVDYEYWTCTTLAPGSDPQHPRATGAAEIVAPIAAYVTPRWSANIAEADESVGEGRYRFDKLRWFKNWPTPGIGYAAPDMGGGSFWGVINHDNSEGIVRIADNRVTPGLKMWTWGFPSLANDAVAHTGPNPAQPYVELWAGVTDQFFHGATLPARSEKVITEAYSPSVGMSNLTDANEDVLVNLSTKASRVSLEFFSLEPATPLRVTLHRGDTVLFDETVAPDPKNGNRLAADIPVNSSGNVKLTIATADGRALIAATAAIK